jgi:hypothetical protein
LCHPFRVTTEAIKNVSGLARKHQIKGAEKHFHFMFPASNEKRPTFNRSLARTDFAYFW